jgi:hypothetical protein
MNASVISRIDPAIAPIAIPAFVPVEIPSLSFLEDVGWAAELEVIGLDVGVLDGLFDCVFGAPVDDGADHVFAF